MLIPQAHRYIWHCRLTAVSLITLPFGHLLGRPTESFLLEASRRPPLCASYVAISVGSDEEHTVEIQNCIMRLRSSFGLQFAPAPHGSMSSRARETAVLHVGPAHCIVLPDAANISLTTPPPRPICSVEPRQVGCPQWWRTWSQSGCTLAAGKGCMLF